MIKSIIGQTTAMLYNLYTCSILKELPPTGRNNTASTRCAPASIVHMYVRRSRSGTPPPPQPPAAQRARRFWAATHFPQLPRSCHPADDSPTLAFSRHHSPRPRLAPTPPALGALFTYLLYHASLLAVLLWALWLGLG